MWTRQDKTACENSRLTPEGGLKATRCLDKTETKLQNYPRSSPLTETGKVSIYWTPYIGGITFKNNSNNMN